MIVAEGRTDASRSTGDADRVCPGARQLQIDGRRWAIEDWAGDRACVPTNEDFGIETVRPATNNWAGRIDHFMIFRGHLHLFKLEVSLAPEFDRARLGGRRREVVCRYEPMTRCDKTGHYSFMKESRSEYLVLDDCRVAFTGQLRLAFPNGDAWEVPTSEDAEDTETETMTLVFENGEIVA